MPDTENPENLSGMADFPRTPGKPRTVSTRSITGEAKDALFDFVRMLGENPDDVTAIEIVGGQVEITSTRERHEYPDGAAIPRRTYIRTYDIP